MARPSTLTLYGLTAHELAPILDPDRPSPAMARRYITGRSDMGSVRLWRLVQFMAGRGIDAANVVRDVAGVIER